MTKIALFLSIVCIGQAALASAPQFDGCSQEAVAAGLAIAKINFGEIAAFVGPKYRLPTIGTAVEGGTRYDYALQAMDSDSSQLASFNVVVTYQDGGTCKVNSLTVQ